MQNNIPTNPQLTNQIADNQNKQLPSVSKSFSHAQKYKDQIANKKIIDISKTNQKEAVIGSQKKQNKSNKESQEGQKNINKKSERKIQNAQQNNQQQNKKQIEKFQGKEIKKQQNPIKQNQQRVFNTIQEIQKEIQSEKAKLEILKKQSYYYQSNRSFQIDPNFSINKNGYQTELDQYNNNLKSHKVLEELQKQQKKKFPKVDVPILKYAEDDKVKLIKYKNQLQQKKNQLKQAKQQQRIKELEQKIAQLEIHIRRIQQKQTESQKQLILPNKNITDQKKEQITKILPNTHKSHKFKKKNNVEELNNIQQNKNKKLVAQQLKKSKVIKQDNSHKKQTNQSQKPQKHQKKLQISSNIYNVALGELLLLQKQRNNQQLHSESNECSIDNKVNQTNSKGSKQKESIEKQKINIPINSQLLIQKQRLQQQVKMLKKKIQELQKLNHINNNDTIAIDLNTSSVKPYLTQQFKTIDNSKPKLRQLHWHSNKKFQNQMINDSILQPTQLPEMFTNFSNPQSQQKKFKSNLMKHSPIQLERNNLKKNLEHQNQEQIQTMYPIQEKEIKINGKQEQKNSIEAIKKITLNNMQFPKLVHVPESFHTSKELIQIGKKTFEVFGIKVQQSQVFNVKKFKNCVYFNFNHYHIVWYYGGKFYIGGWKNNFSQGQKQGHGIQYIPQKYVYQGNFKDGRRCGNGIMKYQNGDKYNGDWLEGLRNGHGRWQQSNGLVYDGQWRQGKKQGFGKLYISADQIYEGMFLRNLKNGYGKQIFKNGDSYHGQYMMNKFSGKGCYKWANGAFYEGQFFNGCRNGHGLWKSGPITPYDTYQGEYINDKKCGRGKYIWQNGSSYQGQFLNDLKHGQGTLRFLGGKILRAIWQNGVVKKKLFTNQEELYKQSKKSPRLYSANKQIQDPQRSMTAKNYRISNKSSSRGQKVVNQYMKESAYRKMQHNSMVRVGDL